MREDQLQELEAKDRDWARVVRWFLKQERLADRVGQVIRTAIDTVLDGMHTGRYDYNQLNRVEKTYLGYLVERFFLHEFGLPRATGRRRLDTAIDGIPVDVKWTGGETKTGQTIPPEAFDNICILLWGQDARSAFSFGIVRAKKEWLNEGNNRDKKRTLSEEGRANIFWLVDEGPLPKNVLYHLDPTIRTKILSHRGGTERVVEFFRHYLEKPVPRSVIVTLGQQLDAAKRVRDARKILRKEGIEVLQGRWDEAKAMARKLGLAVGPDEWIAVRIPAEK